MCVFYQLQHSYGFDCRCTACSNGWPTLASLPRHLPPDLKIKLARLNEAEASCKGGTTASCGLQSIWSERDAALSGGVLPAHHVSWVYSRARLSYWLAFCAGSRW